MKKCFVCGSEILDSHPCFTFHEKKASICMGCEGEKIDVWRVSLLGSGGGYIDRDFESMVEGLRHMESGESFEVHREEMLASKYLSLPEFQGF